MTKISEERMAKYRAISTENIFEMKDKAIQDFLERSSK